MRKHSPDANGAELNTHPTRNPRADPRITALDALARLFLFPRSGSDLTFWEETHSKYSNVTQSEQIIFLSGDVKGIKIYTYFTILNLT